MPLSKAKFHAAEISFLDCTKILLPCSKKLFEWATHDLRMSSKCNFEI